MRVKSLDRPVIACDHLHFACASKLRIIGFESVAVLVWIPLAVAFDQLATLFGLSPYQGHLSGARATSDVQTVSSLDQARSQK